MGAPPSRWRASWGVMTASVPCWQRVQTSTSLSHRCGCNHFLWNLVSPLSLSLPPLLALVRTHIFAKRSSRPYIGQVMYSNGQTSFKRIYYCHKATSWLAHGGLNPLPHSCLLSCTERLPRPALRCHVGPHAVCTATAGCRGRAADNSAPRPDWWPHRDGVRGCCPLRPRRVRQHSAGSRCVHLRFWVLFFCDWASANLCMLDDTC